MTQTTQAEAAPPDGPEPVVACIEAARRHRYTDLDRARREAQRGLDLLLRQHPSGAAHQDEEAELRVLLGSFDRQDGHIESAVVQFHAALKLSGYRPATRTACDAWTGLGWAYAQCGEFSRALRYSLQGLKTARSVGDHDRELHALDVLGTVYAIFGDPVEALRHLELAARIARDTGNRRRLCSVLNNLAMTLLGKGDLEPALAAGQESLRIAQEDALTVAGLNVIDTVASVLTAMGRLTDAQSCLAPAVAEARLRPPNKALANLLGSLGAIRAASGDVAPAESLFAQALDIATRIGDPMLARHCHKRLADLFAATGRWQEAYGEFRTYHELNESIAGAKASKRLTVVRIADEVDALQDAVDPTGPPAEGLSTIDALERLTARLRDHNRELAEARRAAEAASETKSRFLTNMSHELRTPLNGVLGMAHLLKRTKLDANQARYCDAIVQSGLALSDLVTDILDHTSLEAGRLVIESAEFEPARLLEDVLGSVRSAASPQPLRITAEVDGQVPKTVLGDGKRIRQVLLNLVGNAVKFTQRGAVEVRVDRLAAREGDPRIWTRFAVRDTGIGMGQEAAAALFRPFAQGDDSSTRRYGGRGLGLAISRQLVELMGGVIDVRSQPGQGSEFWFDIPLHLRT